MGAMRWRVLGAGTLARVPSEGAALAIVLAVAERGGSVAFAGLLLALTTLPQIVTGPLGGERLDRTRRPGRLIARTALFAALALGALACRMRPDRSPCSPRSASPSPSRY